MKSKDIYASYKTYNSILILIYVCETKMHTFKTVRMRNRRNYSIKKILYGRRYIIA